MVPRSQGGVTERGNLQGLCRRHNRAKARDEALASMRSGGGAKKL